MLSTQAIYFIYFFLSLSLLAQFVPPYGKAFLRLAGSYWLSSVILFSVSTLFFSLSPELPPYFLTVANTAYAASALMLSLTFHRNSAANSDLTHWKAPIAVILVWAVVFESLRQLGPSTYVLRVLMVAASVSISFFIFAIKTYRSSGATRSSQVPIAAIAGLICAVSYLLRAYITISNEASILSIYDEPIATNLIRTVATATNFMMFLLIGNSFTSTLIAAKEKENADLIAGLEVANKAAATGALSAAIAHELNQPLGSMQLNLQLLRKLFSQKDFPHAYGKELLSDSIKDLRRASNIIIGLRGIFTKRYIPYKKRAVHLLISEVCEIVAIHAKGFGITVRRDFRCTGNVAIHPQELQQVILNLMNNAVDALKKNSNNKKEIIVQTDNSTDDLFISIQDNGPGIDPLLGQSIFDLFKSDRADGMGVGLWLSQHIVQRCKGSLTHESPPQGGAKFTVILPIDLASDAKPSNAD